MTTISKAPARRAWTLAAAVVLAGVALSACEYAGGTPPKFGPDANKLGVERTLYRHTVAFPGGDARLPDGERAALERFLADTGADRSATVLVTAADPADLALQRRQQVVRFLRSRGYDPRRADPLLDDHPAPGSDVLVRVARYHVVLPECGDHSRSMISDNSNLPASDFGCSTYRNLGLMVANPRDLLRGRDLAPAEGERVANPVRHYRRGDRWVPGDANGKTETPDGPSDE